MTETYWDQIVLAWQIEREAEREESRRARAELTLGERVERGRALARLHVDDTGAATGGRIRLALKAHDPIERDIFRGSSGSPVTLWWESPDAPSSVSGVLTRRVTDRVTVVVDDPPDRLFEGEFHLDIEAPETTFRAGEKAIAAFRDAPVRSAAGKMRAVLVDQEAPRYADVGVTLLDDALNEEQGEAVRRALGAESVAFIHGPPGTGKTRTLVEIVRQVVRDGGRVLCTAASNAAVDHLAGSVVAAGVDVVRLGHPARVADVMEEHTLDARIEATPDWDLAKKWIDEARAIRRRIDARSSRGGMGRAERRDLYRQARTLMGDAHHHIRRLEEALVEHSSVIAATATSSGNRLLRDMTFDLVVIDEATQSPDPLTMIPLLRGERAVFAGDPQQLPPTVTSHRAEALGLASTFHERHVDDAVVLRVQHRMHAAIMAFPSATSYDDQLVAHESVAGHTLADLGIADDELRPSELVFVDTAGKGWDDAREGTGESTYNRGSAERIAAECRRLLGRGVSPDQVAVIVPYRAQVALMRDLLPSDVEVDTIDSFQGREAEVVLVDLVRSNTDAEIGFLADTRRMNVALTRARRQLIVVGDSATISHHPYYSAFLEAAERARGWVSAWSDEAPEFES